MTPEQARKLLHAYVDGELDPPAILEIEGALAADPALRAAHERLRAMSAAIREKADYHAAPALLAARVAASLPGETSGRTAAAPRRRWLAPAAVFASAVLLGLGVFFMQWDGRHDERLVSEILAGHARATLGGRLIEVASADQHTVKPWLSARLPYSPPVADFAEDGYPLAGGRVDYVDGRPVAVLVYQRRKHSIEAFVWPGDSAGSRRLSREGLNMESFSRAGMTWWLVSDIPAQELAELGRRLGDGAER
jgi:anti-sigma factor RsiW